MATLICSKCGMQYTRKYGHPCRAKLMGCPKCGESYRGLAGDCDCTSYSGGEPRLYRLIPSYEELERQKYAAAKKAEIERLTIEAKEFARTMIMLQGEPLQARKGPGTEPKKPIEPTPPLTGRAPLVLDGREV
jgi:NAD-dependent SIR2 family protein deacetylase